MYGIMWDFSLECDREMERDPNWHETDEGQACLRLVRQENGRLSRILAARRTESPDDT